MFHTESIDRVSSGPEITGSELMFLLLHFYFFSDQFL